MTRYEYMMAHLTSVASVMFAGWTISKDVMGVYLAGLLGTILASIAFYPETQQNSQTGDPQ